MTSPEAVRRVGLALPRAYEGIVGGRRKLKVGQIVFTAFSADETMIGFGFPRDARDGLIGSDPDTFFLPPARDLRYQWVCAHLSRLDGEEMRELVTDAWRMCTPAMLHDLPELPAPAAAAWAAMDRHDHTALRPLLHPHLRLADRGVELRGRNRVLAHLAGSPVPRPPGRVEVRDGQVYRWGPAPP